MTRPSPGRHRPGSFTRPTSCTSSLPTSSRCNPTVFSFVYSSFLLTIDDKNSVKKWNERVCLFVCAWKLFVFIISWILSLPGASKKRWSASLSFLSFASRFTKPWDSFVDVSNASFHLFTNRIRVGFAKKTDDTSAAYCFDQSRSRVARNRPLRTFPSILLPRN